MHTQDILKTWEMEVAQKGRVEGLAQAVIRAYRSRFGAIPDDLQATIEAMHHEPTLTAWVDLVVTASATDIGQAIRRARPS